MKKQIVIEIDEQDYEDIQLLINHCDYEKHLMLVDRICSRVAHGTPIPDNATNGDVMYKMLGICLDDFKKTWGGGEFTDAWWNALCQKGE